MSELPSSYDSPEMLLDNVFCCRSSDLLGEKKFTAIWDFCIH